MPNVQRGQCRKFTDRRHPLIGHPRLSHSQSLELLQILQFPEPGIANERRTKIERFQIGEFAKRPATFVRDRCADQVQLLQRVVVDEPGEVLVLRFRMVQVDSDKVDELLDVFQIELFNRHSGHDQPADSLVLVP